MSYFVALRVYLAHNKTPFLVAYFIVAIASALSQLLPYLLGRGVDVVASGNATNELIWPVLGIIGVGVIEAGLRFYQRYLMAHAARQVEYEVRRDLFGHIQKMDAASLQNIHTGDLMSRATNDLNAVIMFLRAGTQLGINTILTFGVALVLMFTINVGLALLVALTLPFITLLFAVTGTRMNHLYDKVQAQFAAITAEAQENFSGIRVVKAYVEEDRQVAAFARSNAAYIKMNLAYNRLASLMWPMLYSMLGLTIALVLYFGGHAVIDKSITLGQLVQFLGYLALLTWPMVDLGWVINLYQQGAASMTRIAAVWAMQPTITTPADPVPVTTIRGEIEFQNVGLKYGDLWVLHNVSFRVPRGSTTAIVGPTGAGKTTLTSLIARMRDPHEGTVLVDGIDVRRLPLDVLRENIGYVPQETFLFSLSLRENVAFGVATGFGNAEIDRAVETARLSKDLAQFPNGLDTTIGERGVTLSGGQKQRTAIARAVMRDPAILILDDALSSIDTQTQAEIIERLQDVLEGRTSLLISQRLSTIKGADQIIVLDDGRVREQGTHQELLLRDGLYASMYRRELLTQELEV